MAIQFGYPVVPMAITGSYEFNRKGSWMIYPSKIVVYLGEPIETKDLAKTDIQFLRDRVHHLVSEKVEAAAAERHAEAVIPHPTQA